ncbi:hypothetical protein PVK06_040411 [Gossypium arboreum]|uniref:Retrotransposon gag domain-containing protein n=1 Tax=Gossypium arboreum TaxID=29729 RepID=A0ABR0N5D4_GOSAR|nr:hypothetical protein PVK06_040411 [Gossypium arboreum]
MLSIQSRLVSNQERKLISNPDIVTYHQQDKLFASWLLSTVSGYLFSCFTSANTIYDVWSKACHLFAAISEAKIFWLKYELHSLKKGHMIVKEYLAKIKSTYVLLGASGHLDSANEQVDIVLANFSAEFNSVFTITSFSSEPLVIDHLMDILLECKRQ